MTEIGASADVPNHNSRKYSQRPQSVRPEAKRNRQQDLSTTDAERKNEASEKKRANKRKEKLD